MIGIKQDIKWRHTLIKNSSDYTKIMKMGKWVPGKTMQLYFLPGDTLRVGFAVSKKVKTKPKKNRIRRRLREAYRLILPEIPKGWYVFMGTQETLTSGFQDILDEMRNLINKAHSRES